MSDLEIIRAFANSQIPEDGPSKHAPSQKDQPYLAALQSLAQSNEWLKDQSLVERVVSKLESIEPQSSTERAVTAAVYMSIISPRGLRNPLLMDTVPINISDQETKYIPKRLLMAESNVFQQQLGQEPEQTIDLSGQANAETLDHFVTHLSSGKTDFINNANAVELLLLAKKYELPELSMKCLEHILSRKSKWSNEAADKPQISKEELDLRQMLQEAKANSITIERSVEGEAHVKMADGSKEDQWRSLTALHDFIPITHLRLTKRMNVDSLLNFTAYNPNLASLKLGNSPRINDGYLEKLSQHLPQLDSFSISSEKIKTLPQAICDRAISIECSFCENLTHLTAPNALVVHCIDCDNLKSVVAPNATNIDCYACHALTNIDAPNAVSLSCNACSDLHTITAPTATSIGCSGCKALTTIEAPKAEKLFCDECDALKSIDAPRAISLSCKSCLSLTSITAPLVKMLDCGYCTALTEIPAPYARTIKCSGCLALKEIVALHATLLNCGYNPGLTKISAPKAKEINCFGCRNLTEIEAPSVITIDCSNCEALTSLQAPHASKVNCFNCRALTSEVKSNLFDIVSKNIIKMHFKDTEVLNRNLADLLSEADATFGVNDTHEFPFIQWFIDSEHVTVPAEFATEEDRTKCENMINGHLERLLNIAAADNKLDGSNLDWFQDLKKFDSLQQQMNRIKWFGWVLASSASGENVLTDHEAIPSLLAIGNLSDPFVQTGATRALLSLYESKGLEQRETWKSLITNKPEHLLLPSLFLAAANINRDKANELLKGLEARYYRDFSVLNPIVEMAYKLSQEASLSGPKRELLLSLLLKTPEKGIRENAKAYNRRLETFRSEQPKLVTACRDILLFGYGRELKTVQNVEDILEKHKEACQNVFGIKGELLPLFNEAFKSKRYPNGLFTYAARLQTLPEYEKTLLIGFLGRFVNGHLEGQFPENRYDLTVNPHLENIFKNNKELLDKWKEPFEIDLSKVAMPTQDPQDPPRDTIEEQLMRGIDNKHLGEEQETIFPVLMQTVQSNDPEVIKAAIAGLQVQCHALEEQIKQEPLEGQKDLKQKFNHLEIEMACLKALDTTSKLPDRIESLRTLLRKLPEGSEFKNDVRGLFKALDPAKVSKTHWVKIESTESWEDLLLMGTEVNGSCQRIDGDAHYNKCLLAYILDGKNKVMIVRDSNGKIAARSVLRILWDSEQKSPVLFMEDIYAAATDPALPLLIKRGCEEKAKLMGLPLVACRSKRTQDAVYPGPLSALGGPAPYEYVDALSDIENNGTFTITDSNIIYMPSAKDEASSSGLR